MTAVERAAEVIKPTKIVDHTDSETGEHVRSIVVQTPYEIALDLADEGLLVTDELQNLLDRLRIWRGFHEYEGGQSLQNWNLMEAIDVWLASKGEQS